MRSPAVSPAWLAAAAVWLVIVVLLVIDRRRTARRADRAHWEATHDGLRYEDWHR